MKTGTQIEHDINTTVMQRYGAISAHSAALARINRKARHFDAVVAALETLISCVDGVFVDDYVRPEVLKSKKVLAAAKEVV